MPVPAKLINTVTDKNLKASNCEGLESVAFAKLILVFLKETAIILSIIFFILIVDMNLFSDESTTGKNQTNPAEVFVGDDGLTIEQRELINK